jgi:hypothetical protein
MRKHLLVLLMPFLLLLLAACVPAAGPTTLPQPSSTGPVTTVPTTTVALTATVAVTGTITGTALPAGGAASTPITPTLTISGTASGAEGATPVPQSTAAVTGTPPAAVAAAIDDVAKQMGIPPDQLVLVSYEAVNWPDACLGVPKPGVMCAQIVTPGYRIVFEGPHGRFEVHTAASGTPALIVPPQTPLPPPTPVAPPTATPASTSGASGIQGIVTIRSFTLAGQEGLRNSRPYGV